MAQVVNALTERAALPESLRLVVTRAAQTGERAGPADYAYCFTARDSAGQHFGLGVVSKHRHPDERTLAEHVRAAMRGHARSAQRDDQ